MASIPTITAKDTMFLNIFENIKQLYAIKSEEDVDLKNSLVQIAADNNRDEDSFNNFNKIAILKIKVQMKDL